MYVDDCRCIELVTLRPFLKNMVIFDICETRRLDKWDIAKKKHHLETGDKLGSTTKHSGCMGCIATS